MHKRKNILLAVGLVTAAFVAWACGREPTPLGPQVHNPVFHIFPGEDVACFRLTGGGRIDKPEPLVLMPQAKNTPDSRDFATFGFQARPNGCNVPDGSGQIEWVEHNPNAILGGFSFHGVVNWFVAVEDHYGDTGNPKNGCGRFAGNDGRVHGRNGQRFDNVSFVVEHACDRGEPGVGRDHIRICIGTANGPNCELGNAAYKRDGILTGGNIQKHKLSGSGT